jgi:O-antigen/teichoic acid export membrane protein
MSQNHPSGGDFKNRVMKNISLHLAATVFYMATRFFLPPIILSRVSLEAYGIWALCFIVVSYLGMSAFGISNVYIRYVAEYHAKGETDKINRLLSTGPAVVLALSVVILAVLWFLLPGLIVSFKVRPELHQTAFILMFGTAATFMLDLSVGAFAYVLQGLQRMTDQTKVWVVTYCIEAALIVGLLFAGLGVYSLLIAFAVRYLLAVAWYVVLCYRAIPTLELHPRHFDRSLLKLFYGYGGIIQVSGLLSTVLNSIEKVIAGAFIGVKATALFDVGEKFPIMASQIASTINAGLFPAMSHLDSRAESGEVVELYVGGSRYLNLLLGYLMGYLAAFAGPVLQVWLGRPDFRDTAAFILACFCLPYHIHVLTGPGSAFHRGVKKPARELFYPIVQGVLVAVAVLVGIRVAGKTAEMVAVTVAGAMVASALCYIAFSNRYAGVPMKRYLTTVLPLGLIPYAAGFLLRWLAQPVANIEGWGRWPTLGYVVATGLMYSGLVALFIFPLINRTERNFLRDRVWRRIRPAS